MQHFKARVSSVLTELDIECIQNIPRENVREITWNPSFWISLQFYDKQPFRAAKEHFLFISDHNVWIFQDSFSSDSAAVTKRTTTTRGRMTKNKKIKVEKFRIIAFLFESIPELSSVKNESELGWQRKNWQKIDIFSYIAAFLSWNFFHVFPRT